MSLDVATSNDVITRLEVMNRFTASWIMCLSNNFLSIKKKVFFHSFHLPYLDL